MTGSSATLLGARVLAVQHKNNDVRKYLQTKTSNLNIELWGGNLCMVYSLAHLQYTSYSNGGTSHH